MDTTPEPEQLRPASETVEPKAQPTTTIPFEFTGKVDQYFKIWIVNVALTICTLGIYSAWAKVRKKRYLYGNTLLQGTPFEYHGDPVKILKGRLIVVGIVAAYSWATMSTAADLGSLGPLFIVMLPWLVVTARTFNARNSSHRHIRFDFRARWGEAFSLFWVVPGLVGLTAGIAYPYFAYLRSEFLVRHSAFGITPLVWLGQARDKIKTFYAIYCLALLRGVAVALLGFMLSFLGVFHLTMILEFLVPAIFPQMAFQDVAAELDSLGINWLPFFLSALVGVPTVFAYLRSKTTNFIWSNATLGNHRFVSFLDGNRMISLYISNALAILLSLGLLIPWATIRTVRYRLDHFKLLPAGDLDKFVASEQEKVPAVGEEMSAFFDVDVGI